MAVNELILKGTADVATNVVSDMLVDGISNRKQRRIAKRGDEQLLEEQYKARNAAYRMEANKAFHDKKQQDTIDLYNTAKSLSKNDPELEALLKEDMHSCRRMQDKIIAEYNR